jgi:hypothetical protein
MTNRPLTTRLFLVMLCAFLSSISAQAQELVLRAEFWAESEPMPILPPVISDVAPGPRVPDEVAASLLSEARRVFAAMVWGYDFVYVPYDKARKVSEVFELTPRGEIPWGDPRMTATDTRASGTELRVYLEYRPDESGTRRRLAWMGAPYESAQGAGTAPTIEGVGARYKAMDEAAKEALRALLRPIVQNKPREIRGTFAYAEAPRITISGGSYVAVLRIRVKVTEVRAYAAY